MLLDFFSEKVHRAIWPGKIVELERSIQNLSDRVSSYVAYFMGSARLRENSEKPGQGFFVEDKWWKTQWRDDYDDYADKSKKWQNTSTCLLFNVCFALNEYAESVRKHLNPRYFVFEGSFVINDSMGVISEMRPTIYKPCEYRQIEETS